MRYRFAEKLGKALSLYEIRSSKQEKFILHLYIFIIIIIITSDTGKVNYNFLRLHKVYTNFKP